MSKDTEDWIVVGRFGRVHGIKGLITVHSFTDPKTAIMGYLPWHISKGKGQMPIKISQVKEQNQLILASIEGVDDRDKATRYTNVDIVILRSNLPKLGEHEYYWHELIGMHVMNKALEDLGVVTEMLATGSNDVLVVEGKNRYLIPYLPGQFIEKIDSKARIIRVDWDKDF